MTEERKISIWLSHQPDVSVGLTFIQKNRLKEGDHIEVVREHIDKLRRQVRWGRISAGAIGGIMFLAGLFSWAVEFELVTLSMRSGPSFPGLGTLLVLGAAAVTTMFRVAQLQRRVTQFETGRKVDVYFGAQPHSRTR